MEAYAPQVPTSSTRRRWVGAELREQRLNVEYVRRRYGDHAADILAVRYGLLLVCLACGDRL